MKHYILKTGIVGCLMLSMSACQTLPNNATEAIQQANTPRGAANVHLELIAKMLENEQYFAALAHIAEAEQSTITNRNELALMKAESLHALNRKQAAIDAYLPLIYTQYKGRAAHGLGLLYVNDDLPRALGYLQIAALEHPTHATIRSDYGYALMLNRQYNLANDEFNTAAQLKMDDERPKNNLVLLSFIRDGDDIARQLATEYGITEHNQERLRIRANDLRTTLAQRKAVPPMVMPSRSTSKPTSQATRKPAKVVVPPKPVPTDELRPDDKEPDVCTKSRVLAQYFCW